jgi:DNA-binding NarL/FixJ family response regulator
VLHVLLVEDSRLLADRLRESLESLEGVTVVGSVADELAAAEAVAARRVDAIVLDLQLRQGTGFGLLERLGRPRPTVIVFTNYELPEYRRRAKALGVEHFLSKSRDYDRLPELIQHLEKRGAA